MNYTQLLSNKFISEALPEQTVQTCLGAHLKDAVIII